MGKVVAVLILLVVGLGWGISSCEGRASDVPALPTVTVTSKPEVITKEVTRDVPGKMPESCTRAIDLLNKSLNYDVAISKAAGQIADLLGDVTRLSVTRDFAALNAKQEELAKVKHTLDEAQVTKQGFASDVAAEQHQCNLDSAVR